MIDITGMSQARIIEFNNNANVRTTSYNAWLKNRLLNKADESIKDILWLEGLRELADDFSVAQKGFEHIFSIQQPK